MWTHTCRPFSLLCKDLHFLQPSKKRNHVIFAFLCLVFLNIVISSFIHVLTNDKISPFLWVSNTLHTRFFCPFIRWWTLKLFSSPDYCELCCNSYGNDNCLPLLIRLSHLFESQGETKKKEEAKGTGLRDLLFCRLSLYWSFPCLCKNSLIWWNSISPFCFYFLHFQDLIPKIPCMFQCHEVFILCFHMSLYCII